MADLGAGRFGADLLVLWESSRGSRQVSEWVALLEACEAASVRIHVTSHGHTYDPARPRDRRSLLEDALDSEYESGKTSERVRRAMVSNAERGEPHGRTPFGYRRRYNPVTRRLEAQEPEPDEARIVTEIFFRLYRHHSLREICADFARRGITTRSGGKWSANMIRDLAIRPLYAGLRAYQPGNKSGRYRGSLEAAVKGTWPAIVDLDTFAAVRATLIDPARRRHRSGKACHLLSLIARCDVCGEGLKALTEKRKGRTDRAIYRCMARGCVSISEPRLDACVTDVVLGYLRQPDVAGYVLAADDSGELAALEGSLATARAELSTLHEAVKAGKLSITALIDLEGPLARRVEDLEARQRELTTPSELAWLLEPGQDTMAARWDSAPLAAKRDVARLLCSPAALGELRVKPTGRGVQRQAHERVNWKRVP
jgi:DNA invertase Pin-like site-specific DNA recombinase